MLSSVCFTNMLEQSITTRELPCALDARVTNPMVNRILVYFQKCVSGKCFEANVTGKWFLAQVGTVYMLLQTCSSHVRFLARRTLVLLLRNFVV